MTMPVRSLPVLQKWDCGVCGLCCRVYHVPVTEEERARIESQGWEKEEDFKGIALFAKEGSWLRTEKFRLNHRPDDACVFLGADNRCRIHAKFGSAAKPLACRVYPFLLVPAGDHWRLGIRYACPSAAGDRGRPIAEHIPDTGEFVAALEANNPTTVGSTPIPLQARQIVPWSDLLRIATAVSKLLGDTSNPMERRWRTVLGLVGLCRGLKWDGGGDPKKAVTGGRLSEMLHVLGQAADEDTPRSAEEVPSPGWVGRVVFRQVAAVYARKDHGIEKGTAQRTPAGRILAGMRFARGAGRIPKVHARLPDVDFSAGEQPSGLHSHEIDGLLTRYYRMKVESLQFCGPTNFGVSFWDGLESLAMTFPVVMWLARVLVAGGLTKDEAVLLAIRIVDDNFGFNLLLRLGRQRFALRLLAARGELVRLIAWYAR